MLHAHRNVDNLVHYNVSEARSNSTKNGSPLSPEVNQCQTHIEFRETLDFKG